MADKSAVRVSFDSYVCIRSKNGTVCEVTDLFSCCGIEYEVLVEVDTVSAVNGSLSEVISVPCSVRIVCIRSVSICSYVGDIVKFNLNIVCIVAGEVYDVVTVNRNIEDNLGEITG